MTNLIYNNTLSNSVFDCCQEYNCDESLSYELAFCARELMESTKSFKSKLHDLYECTSNLPQQLAKDVYDLIFPYI